MEALALPGGWTPLSVPVPAGAHDALLRTDRIYPPACYPNDARQLAVRVRRPTLHADPVRHDNIRRQHENTRLNLTEMLEGRTVLASTPPSLGIDLHGACNVKPPCVYCEWDYSAAPPGHPPGAARGRFHDYCLRSVACPIVRKSDEASRLPARQHIRLELRKYWSRFNRRTGGLPNQVYSLLRRSAGRGWRALTDPADAARHARRLIRRALRLW